MVKALLYIASAVSLIVAAAIAVVWRARAALPYNEEGRYFDPEQGIVLHEQSLPVLGAIAIALALLALVLLLIAKRR